MPADDTYKKLESLDICRHGKELQLQVEIKRDMQQKEAFIVTQCRIPNKAYSTVV